MAGGAIAFLGVFTYLAARFNYPDVLDGPAATVLPSLLATGQQGRLVWALYAFLPLIWVPAAGVATFEALAPVRRGAMQLALLFAVVAALAMMLGLMRWPSVHWHPPRWIGWVGVATAILGLIGMFRNVMSAVAPIAALNNYLLPAFMIILGVALVRSPAVSDSAAA